MFCNTAPKIIKITHAELNRQGEDDTCRKTKIQELKHELLCENMCEFTQYSTFGSSVGTLLLLGQGMGVELASQPDPSTMIRRNPASIQVEITKGCVKIIEVKGCDMN